LNEAQQQQTGNGTGAFIVPPSMSAAARVESHLESLQAKSLHSHQEREQRKQGIGPRYGDA
jgi:hypothetical protein